MVFDSDNGHFYYWLNTQWVQVPTGTGTTQQSLENILLVGNDAGGTAITNLPEPINASDAATKQYVDGLDISDADADPENEIQDLELQGATLRITGNATATNIDLAPFSGTNTDNQTLSLSGTDLNITGGNSVDLSPIQDGFEANTDNQNLSFAGTDLSISGGNSIDLASLQDGTGSDNQTLSIAGTSLSISSGNSVNLAGLRDGTGTDDQQLSLSGNNLQLEDGGSVNMSAFLDNTDDQVLRLSGTDLSISGGNTIDVSSLQDGFEANTDNQNLSFSGTTLTIAGGNAVNLASLQDGTGSDNQTLDRVGNTISISGGNTVTVIEQVAFKATTVDYALGTGINQLRFNSEDYDLSPRTGGSFENNAFVAPLRGIYSFNIVFSSFFDTGVKGRLILRVDGVNRQYIGIDTDQNVSTFSSTIEILLQAGETVDFALQSTTGANVQGYSTRLPETLETIWTGRMVVDLSR